jgi:hypothetical protein
VRCGDPGSRHGRGNEPTCIKLERGAYEDPPLRYVNNRAIVLGVEHVEQL